MRIADSLYEIDCQLFRNINKHYPHKLLNSFFKTITHVGGATFTISITLLFLFLSSSTLQLTAIASAISLTISHLPVAFIKKVFPRNRPYVVLDEIHVLAKPLRDHSFPSGHTTAIFSVIIPFILLTPSLGILLLPLGGFVGLSRIFLGLHYPSDVVVGCVLGSSVGFCSYLFVQHIFLGVL